MSQVELIDAEQAPLLARAYYRDDGTASPIVRALAQVPELAEVALPFIARVTGPTHLDPRTKEIVLLRISARNECRYCVQTHTVAAWDAGLSTVEVAALVDGDAALTALGERDRALASFCDAICGPGSPERDVARLREHFREHELVELSLLAATTVMLNRFCTTLELPTSSETLARLETAR